MAIGETWAHMGLIKKLELGWGSNIQTCPPKKNHRVFANADSSLDDELNQQLKTGLASSLFDLKMKKYNENKIKRKLIRAK